MTPGEIARSYDQLAEDWYWNRVSPGYGIRQHERALSFLRTKGLALDIGCGSSGRIIDLLMKHGFVVEGLDISARMIELAGQRHPDVRFHHADICEWEFPARYDFISAWDSIWHIPLARQEPVLRKILHGLTPGGVCIFTTGGLDGPSEKVDSAMGPPMYYSALGLPDAGADSRGRMHLQAPGVRSASRTACFRHCAEGATRRASRPWHLSPVDGPRYQ